VPSRTVTKEILVEGEAPRLDKYCVGFGVNRSIFALDSTIILVDGRPAKKSRPLKGGEKISLTWVEAYFENALPEDIPLNVLYEDDAILVINKPAGMVVHPAAGNWDHTLVNALLYRYGDEFSTNEDEEEDSTRPGIVHRLDKETSGTMIIAKTTEAHQNLARQFKEHSNIKRYIAVSLGKLEKSEGHLDTGIIRSKKDRKKFTVCPLGQGKEAITDWKVLKSTATYSLLSVTIHTGRTHQIRVHLASLGHPVVGDPVYGKASPGGMLLHAFSLTILHPDSGKPMTFRSPLPERFKSFLSPTHPHATSNGHVRLS